jgi:hypothetical protein
MAGLTATMFNAVATFTMHAEMATATMPGTTAARTNAPGTSTGHTTTAVNATSGDQK